MLNAMNLMGMRPGGLTEEDMERLRAMQTGGVVPPPTPVPPPVNLLNPFAIMQHLATNPVPHPALQQMVAGLLTAGDAMPSAERAAYYQATGERISGGGEQEAIPAARPVPAAEQAPAKTVDPAKERAYLRQREEEKQEFLRQQEAAKEAAKTAPKKTYYGD